MKRFTFDVTTRHAEHGAWTTTETVIARTLATAWRRIAARQYRAGDAAFWEDRQLVKIEYKGMA